MDPVLIRRAHRRPHDVTWKHAAGLAVQIHRTAAGESAARAGLSTPLQKAALQIPARVALARLEPGPLGGRRHLLAALRILTELESHLRIAIDLLPDERNALKHHLRAGQILYRLILTLALRPEPGRVTDFRVFSP